MPGLAELPNSAVYANGNGKARPAGGGRPASPIAAKGQNAGAGDAGEAH
jgi:hypothetical protein